MATVTRLMAANPGDNFDTWVNLWPWKEVGGGGGLTDSDQTRALSGEQMARRLDDPVSLKSHSPSALTSQRLLYVPLASALWIINT
jgi:hypothetical protein